MRRTSSRRRGAAVRTPDLVPFRTYHNVEEPLGFLIEDGRTKERLLWAVDTANLGVTADRLTYIAVECNYEEACWTAATAFPRCSRSAFGTVISR